MRLSKLRDPIAPQAAWLSLAVMFATLPVLPGAGAVPAPALSPDTWRRENRIIDMHMHIEAKPERLERAVRIMDEAGIGTGVILGSGTVTKSDGNASEFERFKGLTDSRFPGRFVHYMLLDYNGWAAPDWSERAARQIEDGHRLGAAGLKEFKRLGLFLRDPAGALLRIDDPKLDAVWRKCGELGMPVSIHVADPRAFWRPYDATNERWKELKDHRNWWFGEASKFPRREELLSALDRVIARHPGTTFVCVHFANNAEDLGWVDRALDKHPNMMADIAARVPEIGRHAPEDLRRLFLKHQDRLLFGTDFQVYDKLILGSSGDDEWPTDSDALMFYGKHWRFFETNDRDWPHMTPIQGDWTISSIGLAPEAARKVYFDNARRLLARSLPLPVLKARRTARDFPPDGAANEPEWNSARPALIEYQARDVSARPRLSTTVRALWSDRFLYLFYECPFTELSTFSPVQKSERIGLWENDVVEAFIGSDPARIDRYTEYEWAPSAEQLDLKLDPPGKDFEWDSKMESVVAVDGAAKVWRVEVRIPMESLAAIPPSRSVRWRINLFRHDRVNKAHLAWSPTLAPSFHTPARFGWLEFGE